MPKWKKDRGEGRDFLRAKALVAASIAVTVTITAAVLETAALPCRTKRCYNSVMRAARPAPFCLDTLATTLQRSGISFESYFRLSRPLLTTLIERLSPYLQIDKDQGFRSTGHAITPAQRVVVALRWMAGALWQDISIILAPISRKEIYKSIWMVVDAINSEFKGEWAYPTPGPSTGRDEKMTALNMYSKLEMRFRAKSPQNCMEGVIGAIDGCIIRTKSPGKCVQNPADYFCERKKTYGLLLMAVSDADMVIRFWDMKFTPKCHDSTAWNGTKLGAWVAAGNLPHPFCFLGDKAFRPGSASLLTPGTNAGTTDAYKYVQSRGRMPAEQCFGILMRTWGILWRPLEVRFPRRAPLVSALIHLHNFRRSTGAPINIAGGHEIRYHKGRQQWGIKQQKRVGRKGANDEIKTFINWVDSPTFDEDGRPVELLGLVNRDECQINENQSLSAQLSTVTGSYSAAQRIKILENKIAELGVLRPPCKRG